MGYINYMYLEYTIMIVYVYFTSETGDYFFCKKYSHNMQTTKQVKYLATTNL